MKHPCKMTHIQLNHIVKIVQNKNQSRNFNREFVPITILKSETIRQGMKHPCKMTHTQLKHIVQLVQNQTQSRNFSREFILSTILISENNKAPNKISLQNNSHSIETHYKFEGGLYAHKQSNYYQQLLMDLLQGIILFYSITLTIYF